MNNRSASVSVFAWHGLAILAGARLSLVAGGGAYLPAIGPTPLRFQTAPAITADVQANVVAPTLPPPGPATEPAVAPAKAAAPTVTVPEGLRSLVLSPLWSALGEGLVLNPLAGGGFVTTQNPTAASTPVVTTEMLVDFFRTAAEASNGGTTNSAVTTGQAFATPVFVLPASSATYRTP